MFVGWNQVKKHKNVISRVNAIFTELDTDKNGLIGSKEIQLLISELREEIPLCEIDELVKQFDTDFDDQLDTQDFIKMVTEGVKQQTKSQTMDFMFDIIDRDKDGLISKEDFKNFIDLMGETVSEEEVETVFKIFDESKDGNIDSIEFSTVLMKDEFKKAFIF